MLEYGLRKLKIVNPCSEIKKNSSMFNRTRYKRARAGTAIKYNARRNIGFG